MTERTGVARRRLLAVVGILTLVVGIGSFAGGAFGAVYTWNQAAAENITTPDDAIFPEVPLRGPLSMYAQADIIEHHQLDSTEGLRYSEMPRQVASVDEAGNPVIGEDGEPVMVANAARASWITATSLITALNVGLLAYALVSLRPGGRNHHDRLGSHLPLPAQSTDRLTGNGTQLQKPRCLPGLLASWARREARRHATCGSGLGA